MAKTTITLAYTPHARQILAHTTTATYVLYGGAVGGGKALAVDTPIKTPTGWTTIGQIVPGDTVYNEQGQSCVVLRCSGTMLNHTCRRVVFDDGSTIVADAGHLWETTTYDDRCTNSSRTEEYRTAVRVDREKERTSRPVVNKHPGWPWMHDAIVASNKRRHYKTLAQIPPGVRTTDEIMFTLTTTANSCGEQTWNHTVGLTGPLQGPEVLLPIDPYVLGLWLGDGCTDSPVLTCEEPAVLDAVRATGQAITAAGTFTGTRKHFRALGLLGNKHIPAIYQNASVSQRLSLLQGLMDSDGYVDKDGRYVFAVICAPLAEGFYDLVLSLGIKAKYHEDHNTTFRGKPYKPVYSVRFRTSLPVSRLQRKLCRLQVREKRKHAKTGWANTRYITAVVPVDSVPVCCIEVDSPSHLYLAGRNLIPTHNSVWLCNEAVQQCLDWPGNRVGLFRWENKSFMMTTYRTLMEWLPMELVEKHNQAEQWIRFKNGSTIIYGGIRPSTTVSSGDAMARLKSLELGCAGIDEVTEVPESFYNLLTTRTQRVWVTDPATKQRCRPPNKVFATCNPEPGWVKLRWVDKALPNHAFIPSTLDDNPHLPPSYKANLIAQLPADWVARYVKGDWSSLSAVNALYPQAWITRATRPHIRPNPLDTQLGLDVATYGDDKTILARRQGYVVDIYYQAPPQDTMATANQVGTIQSNLKAPCRIDGVGVGAGVYDRLAELKYPVETIIGGAEAQDKARFFNLRAELHWGLRILLEYDLVQLPEDAELLNEMGAIKYMITGDRRVQIESKEAMRKRGLKSPNKSDAVVYCCGHLGLRYIIGGLVRF